MPYTAAVLDAWLNEIFNAGTPATYTNIYVSLHSADPAGTGANELSGSGYARSNGTGKFAAASAGALSNTSAISFGPASGSNWAQATYFGLWTASTAGTFLGGFALTNPETVQIPNTASFGVGALTASIT